MRINKLQRQAIQSVFQSVFGEGEVVLFGSRVDNNKKGGDIDLFIKPSQDSDDFFKKKLSF